MDLFRRMTYCSALVLLLTAAVPAGQRSEPAPSLRIEAILLSPDRPAAETLCQLRLRLHNDSEKPISGLELRVALDGRELTVYRNQLLMDFLAPRAPTEIELFNFWTTESDRPAPTDGQLRLEISVEKAHWLEITAAADGTETWTLLEPVPGLPIAKRVEIALLSSAAP